MAHDSDYSTLLDLFIRLVQSQADEKIENGSAWLNDAQVLAIKLFRHLVSMKSLAEGATIKTADDMAILFVDHGSVKVIARAALETYLVFFYLYSQADRALCEFRHKTWQLGGLADRQKFHVSTQEGRAVKAREQPQIEKLRAEITACSYMNGYSEKQRKKLLEGEWRIGNGWADLGAQAGFHKKYFDNVYGYLCGYSHSSYLSALQSGQAQSIEDQQKLSKAILEIGVVLMAHFAFSYSEVFEKAKTLLSLNSTSRAIAEKWRFGAEDIAAIYDR